MGGADVFLGGQVGDSSAHLQNPIISPRAESELCYGRLEKLLGVSADRTEFLYLPRPHLGVGVYLSTLESLKLPLPGTRHPLPDALRALPFGTGNDVSELDLPNIDLEVNPVEERPRNLGVVILSLRVRAVSIPARKTAEYGLAGLCCLFAMSP